MNFSFKNRILFRSLVVGLGCGSIVAGTACADDPPVSLAISTAADGEALQKSLSEQLLILNVRVSQRAPAVDLFSQRGDIHVFMGNFPRAITDYRKMVEIDPSQAAGHWRLGIALFYDHQFKEAAAQFDSNHASVPTDRDNEFWRYFAHGHAFGKEEARGLLPECDGTDGDLVRYFRGELSARNVLERIQTTDVPEQDHPGQRFHVHFYVGMNSVLNGDPETGLREFKLAVEDSWPRKAGYRSNYLWHLARLQLRLLQTSH